MLTCADQCQTLFCFSPLDSSYGCGMVEPQHSPKATIAYCVTTDVITFPSNLTALSCVQNHTVLRTRQVPPFALGCLSGRSEIVSSSENVRILKSRLRKNVLKKHGFTQSVRSPRILSPKNLSPGEVGGYLYTYLPPMGGGLAAPSVLSEGALLSYVLTSRGGLGAYTARNPVSWYPPS